VVPVAGCMPMLCWIVGQKIPCRSTAMLECKLMASSNGRGGNWALRRAAHAVEGMVGVWNRYCKVP